MNRQTTAAGAIAVIALATIAFLVVREISEVPQGTGESGYLKVAAEISDKTSHLYQLKHEFAPPMKNPRSIAAGPDGAVYVAGDNSLIVCDMTGTVIKQITLDDTPRAMAVDKAGLVYAGMTDHVAVVDTLADTIDTWAALDEIAIITSVAIFKRDVYVADAGNRVVLRFDTYGRLLGRIDGRFVIPSPYFDIAVDPSGSLWIADTGRHTLARFETNGIKTSSWGNPGLDVNGFSGCCNPVHFAITSDGSFITSEKGLQRIKVHDAAGRYVGIIAGPRDMGGGAEGLDLAVTEGGAVLVLMSGSAKIRIYEKPG